MIPAPVLLVEDNPDDVLLTRRAFAKNGVPNEVLAVADAAAAIALLTPGGPEPALRPALILLDVALPPLGGLELLRRIRGDRRTSTLPVVMLTTSREEADVAAAYRLGANGFVRKPVALAEFLGTVDALARYWLNVNEPPPNSVLEYRGRWA